MFERFSDRARKVIALANQEAAKFHHGYVGTEHILLALIGDGGGAGVTVLKALNVDCEGVRRQIESVVKRGTDLALAGKLPQTPRAKKVIEFATEEARNLGDKSVGTDHLLVGLVRVSDGLAGVVLGIVGVTLENTRMAIKQLPRSE